MGFEHGRGTVVKIDDLGGALQDVSAYFKGTSGFVGKSDRPETTAFSDNAQKRAVLGLRDGGQIQLGGFLRQVAGTSIHGRQVRLMTDQFAFEGYFKNLSLGRKVDLPETTTFGASFRARGVVGLKDSTLSMSGFFDSVAGRSDERFRTYLAQAGAPLFAIAPAGFAIGNLVDMFQAVQGEYNIGSQVGDVVPVDGSFMGHDVVDLGVSLHDLTAETGTVNSASVDWTDVTTTSGWVAQLHVSAITGSGCTIKVQDSADNSSFADISGATFSNVTAVTKERLEGAATATVRRYTRSIISVMAASSITYVVAFARRGYITATAGTYKHFAGLYGQAASSTYEYGPEGNTTGDRRFTGECRLQSLDTSYALEDVIQFSASFVTDGVVTENTWP